MAEIALAKKGVWGTPALGKVACGECTTTQPWAGCAGQGALSLTFPGVCSACLWCCSKRMLARLHGLLPYSGVFRQICQTPYHLNRADTIHDPFFSPIFSKVRPFIFRKSCGFCSGRRRYHDLTSELVFTQHERMKALLVAKQHTCCAALPIAPLVFGHCGAPRRCMAC